MLSVSARSQFVPCLLLGGLSLVSLGCQSISSLFQPKQASDLAARPVPGVSIDKQPVNFATRNFDPDAPPPEMPPLGLGENAECDSNFMSDASVGGRSQRVDATHAVLTITQIKMTLRLNVTIWVPFNVTEHIVEHEGGHRQISEDYYQSADQIARRIAAARIGAKVEVSGTDLTAASNEMLEQVAAEVTDEFGKELNPDAAQLLFDSITDHSRNDVSASDAVAEALRQDPPDAPPASAAPGN